MQGQSMNGMGMQGQQARPMNAGMGMNPGMGQTQSMNGMGMNQGMGQPMANPNAANQGFRQQQPQQPVRSTVKEKGISIPDFLQKK